MKDKDCRRNARLSQSHKLVRFVVNIIELLLLLFWVIALHNNTDSYYSVYVLCAILACIGYVADKTHPAAKENNLKYALAFSLMFGMAVIFANRLSAPFWRTGLCFLGAVINGYYMVSFFLLVTGLVSSKQKPQIKGAMEYDYRKSKYSFLIAFFLFAGVFLSCFITCNYPGNLTTDSLIQLEQALSNNYSNHHPFLHTLMIKIFLTIGARVFHSLDSGIALYSIFQILAMSFCFAYSVKTAYDLGAKRWCLIVLVITYALLPFHISYSMTMWKDVLFGGSGFLLSTSLLRLLLQIEHSRKIDFSLFTVGAVGFALLRNNGWLALLLSFFAFLFLFPKTHRTIKRLLIGILVLSLLIKGPVLNAIGVQKTEFRESLSIPCQQIASVVANNGRITEEQKEMLGRVIDVDSIPEKYKPYISDPIKFSMNDDVLSSDKMSFLKLYISLGVSNPGLYFRAWIDQTRGYWNGGYKYWVWRNAIRENELGFKQSVLSPRIKELFSAYSEAFFNCVFLQPFVSIGFYVWLLCIFITICFVRRKKEHLIIAIPSLSVIITLLVATPVFSEFRYAYVVMTTVPFLFLIASTKQRERKEPLAAEGLFPDSSGEKAVNGDNEYSGEE